MTDYILTWIKKNADGIGFTLAYVGWIQAKQLDQYKCINIRVHNHSGV